MQDSGRGQVLIIKHVLCVMPGNEHNKNRASTARAHANSLINTRLFSLLIHDH